MKVSTVRVLDIRYPRQLRPPLFYTDYDYEVQEVTDIDYCYGVACDVPQTLKEGLSSSESEQWVKATKENITFTSTSLPKGKHAVGGLGLLEME